MYCYDVHKLAEAPPEERYRARQEFGNYLLQYYDLLNIVMEKHIVDPDNTSAAPIGSFYKKVCGVVNFPHFVAFMEIALCWFREVPPCPCKHQTIILHLPSFLSRSITILIIFRQRKRI